MLINGEPHGIFRSACLSVAARNAEGREGFAGKPWVDDGRAQVRHDTTNSISSSTTTNTTTSTRGHNSSVANDQPRWTLLHKNPEECNALALHHLQLRRHFGLAGCDLLGC